MWYAKPKYGYVLESTEATSNIIEIRNYLMNNYSYTAEAVTGVICNCFYEGGLNPWRWGGDVYPPDPNGCGLYGFTPYTRYLTYPGSDKMNMSVDQVTPNAEANVGEQQTELMASGTWGWVNSCWRSYWNIADYQDLYVLREHVLQTFGNGSTLSLSQYATINEIRSAVFAFLACFEGPQVPNYGTRISIADYVYDVITGNPPQPVPLQSSGMPVYMMIKRFI